MTKILFKKLQVEESKKIKAGVTEQQVVNPVSHLLPKPDTKIQCMGGHWVLGTIICD